MDDFEINSTIAASSRKEVIKYAIVSGVFVVGLGLGLEELRKYITTHFELNSQIRELLYLPVIFIIHISYIFYVRKVERRFPDEFSTESMPKDLFLGCLSAVLAFSSLMFIFHSFGIYRPQNTTNEAAIFQNIGFLLYVAYFEELAYRGLLFRLGEQLAGLVPAIFMSGVVFAIGHADNTGANWLSFTSIFLIGIAFCLIYKLTHQLWFVISAHFFWNYTQGNLFGVSVSGYKFDGFISGTLHGDQILTGGAFGVEASIITIIFFILIDLGLLLIYSQNNSIN